MPGPPCRHRHVATASSAAAALWRPFRVRWPNDCCPFAASFVERGSIVWPRPRALGESRSRPAATQWAPRVGPPPEWPPAVWYPRRAPTRWTMRTAATIRSTSPRCTSRRWDGITRINTPPEDQPMLESPSRTACTRWARRDRRLHRPPVIHTTPRRLPYRATVPAHRPRRPWLPAPITWHRHRPPPTITVIVWPHPLHRDHRAVPFHRGKMELHIRIMVGVPLVAPVPCQENRFTRSPIAHPRPFPVHRRAEVGEEEWATATVVYQVEWWRLRIRILAEGM